MHEFRDVAVVLYIHGHLLTFLHAEQRPRHLAVVANRLDRLAGCKFEFDRGDAKGKTGSASKACSEAEVEAVPTTDEQPDERIETPDNADTPASWRNSLRFMMLPPIGTYGEILFGTPVTVRRTPWNSQD